MNSSWTLVLSVIPIDGVPLCAARIIIVCATSSALKFPPCPGILPFAQVAWFWMPRIEKPAGASCLLFRADPSPVANVGVLSIPD